MAVDTSTATKPRATMLGRVGLGGTVLSGVALAVPLVYTAYAAITGGVTLTTADAITNLFTMGIILTGVAGVLGVLALALHVPGMLAAPRRGFVSGGASVALLALSAAFLFAGIMPRANAITHLNNDVVPFATTMRDSCKVPLNAVTADLAKARDDAQANLTSDATFAVAMQADALKLTADANALMAGVAKLNAAVVPDPKYQQLKDDCIAAAKGQAAFLTNHDAPNAIALPAPYNAIQAKVSVVELVGLGAQIASGKGPVTLPTGTIEGLLYGALDQIVTLTSASEAGKKLAAEGDALTRDIEATLTDNLAPFKSGIAVK
jgi:hypothetical protein